MRVGRKASGDDWRVARNVVVAETDEQALEWVMDSKGGNYHYFAYLIEVMRRANYTIILKENPNDSDETLTVANLTKNQVIYGSSRTVIEKLAALRENVGPFGTLLLASMDASGRNRHREWETMRRLARDVAPALSKMK
ncbi:hypothetical protein [Paraburkholderia elongata]|uniref:Uncharacterized protein n=1 Tax=Paraburkholderia elongata TaxID=2675747 RepID=A0A972NGT5_9BURK|nr:hypothetical protein [Paraburkholderia elongata]NPT53076.1 hypothetical protein [Paraburkholderia elongata]